MNVALVCERFDAAGGGLEQWAVRFARELSRRHHHVHVVTFHASGVADDRIDLHVLPWSGSRVERVRRAESAAAHFSADVVHDIAVGCRCDIVHPQGGSRLVNEERNTVSLSWQERCVRGLRPSFWRWRAEWYTSERRQYAGHDGLVIAPSRKVMVDLEGRHSVPRARIRVIANGVDVVRFSPRACAALRPLARRSLGLQDEETVFLFAAHNHRLKGLRPLLRAMRQLLTQSRRVRLLVIGSQLDSYARRLIERLGIGAAVLAPGFVPDQVPLYAAADAFVLPTYYDACSLSVLEAAACGLPAVTTRHNGVSDLIAHQVNGFVLGDPDDVDLLARTLAQLIDPELRATMADPARALAERHTFGDSVSMIERAYDEVRTSPRGAGQ